MTDMNSIVRCPMCESPDVTRETYDEVLVRNGKSVKVSGLVRYNCPNCKTQFTDNSLSRHNASVTQEAFGAGGRYIRPDALREWRKALGITQRQAARIFGGGLNAFSKYETGEIVPVDSMDNLLWLCMQYTGLVVRLARRRSVPLSAETVANCGGIAQTYPAPQTLQSAVQFSIDSHPSVTALVHFEHTEAGHSEITFGQQLRPSNDRSYDLSVEA